MKKRYAVIAKKRMQISGFVNNPDAVNAQSNILVDMETHLQKDEVEKGWFYDEESNSFSAEGEVIYPEPVYREPEDTDLTQTDRIEAAVDYLMATKE